jgi:hypothetical protein
MTDKCETCKFCVERPSRPEPQWLECHFTAPTWRMVNGRSMDEPGWPKVQGTDWCGEYQAKP